MEVGPNIYTDVARTLILLVGFTLSMVCLKFALLARRSHEGYRAWGLASYGLIVVTPAINGLYRYDSPLVLVSTFTYAAGLACGLAGLRYSYTVSPEWRRMRAKARGEH